MMGHLTPYQKGYVRELKAKALMESWFGAVVMRSAGSHTQADLLCGNGVQVFAVQVKSESDASTVNWDKLRYFAQMFQAIPTLLVYCAGGRWKVYFDGERWRGYDTKHAEIP
jgi:Holliday junction resolvase